jgi:hypothetical protein
MHKLKKISLILVINLIIFGILDFIFGVFISGPPEYLNTKNQYSTNYRNYFVEFKDQNGEKFFGVDNTKPVDVTYQNTSFKPNSIKVLAIGDSFTAGQGIKRQDTWIKQLEKLSPQKLLYGINYGYAGIGIREVFEVFNKHIKNLNPDLIVYAYVLNDPIAKPTSPLELDIDEKNEYPHDNGLYFDLINYRSIVFDKNRGEILNFFYNNFNIGKYLIRILERKAVSEKTVKFYKNLHDPEINREGLNETLNLIQIMNETSVKNGSKFVVMIFPLFFNTQKNYPFSKAHTYLTSEMKRRNIQTLDLLPSYLGIQDSELWVHPIDQHPNDYAQSIAAKALRDWMIENKFF